MKRAIAILVALGGMLMLLWAALAQASASGPAMTGLATPAGNAALARRAFANGDYPAANAAARAALRSQPYDQNLLTIAALTEDDPARAGRAINLTGALGWRDPSSQLLLAKLGYDAGQPDIYLQRVRALLLVDPRNEALPALLDQLLAGTNGQGDVAALIGQLPEQSMILWQAPAASQEALRTRALALKAAAKTMPAGVRADAARGLVQRMLTDKLPQDAYAIWKDHLAVTTPGAGLPGSTPILPLVDDPTVFDWKMDDAATGDLAEGPDGAIVFLSTSNRGSAILSRSLPPLSGPLTIRAQVPAAPRKAPLWRVQCQGRNLPVPVEKTGGEMRAILFIPPTCGLPRFQIRAAAGGGETGVGRILIQTQ